MSLLEKFGGLPSALSITSEEIKGHSLELRRLQQLWGLRETKFEAQNGQGFVRLVDCYGSDDSVVNAARLTAQSEGRGADDDRTLLRYLMRHLHTTPFEFGQIVVHVRVPMDTWRQWVRLTSLAA